MGRRPYLDDDIASERLVMPLDNILSTGWCLALVSTPRGRELPYGPRFRQWIADTSRTSAEIWKKLRNG